MEKDRQRIFYGVNSFSSSQLIDRIMNIIFQHCMCDMKMAGFCIRTLSHRLTFIDSASLCSLYLPLVDSLQVEKLKDGPLVCFLFYVELSHCYASESLYFVSPYFMLGILCTKDKWCERSRVHAGWKNCSWLLDFHFDAQHATNKQACSSAFLAFIFFGYCTPSHKPSAIMVWASIGFFDSENKYISNDQFPMLSICIRPFLFLSIPTIL